MLKRRIPLIGRRGFDALCLASVQPSRSLTAAILLVESNVGLTRSDSSRYFLHRMVGKSAVKTKQQQKLLQCRMPDSTGTSHLLDK